MLLTGRQEPNVDANRLAQESLSHEGDLLQQEITNLRTELELDRELAGDSPMAIIERQVRRGQASDSTFQGDTEPDRLHRIEKPCGATISVRERDNQDERRCRGATIMPSWFFVSKGG
jgi:hypothetical protein